MSFKKLTVDVKIDDFPPPLRMYMEGNFKISNGKIYLVAYL